MDEKQSVPLWISDFLFCDVFSNAVDDVSCVFRSRKSASGSYLVMDLEASVELGVSWRECFAGNRAVRIWILQCDADFYCAGNCYNDPVQAAKLVCLLSYGNNDPINLQGEE